MGQTTRGIKYPSDYSEVADVPEDLRKMAESIDELFREHDTSIENLENQCEDFALVTETGNKLVLEIDNNTYKIKAVLKDKNNNVIDTSNEIDLPLEEMVTNVSYNNQSLVLTYKSGQTSNVSIADLINGLVNEEDFNALEEIVETNSKDIVDIAKENRELQSQISDLETLVETELESNEVEGTEIDVSDSAEYPGKIIPGANLEQEQLDGNQLIDFNNGMPNKEGVTYTFSNDVLTLTGNNTGYSYVILPITELYKSNPGKVLKFVYDTINVDNQFHIIVQILIEYNDGTSKKYVTLLKHNLENLIHTIPNDVSNIKKADLQIYSNNTSTAQNSSVTITKPMLQFGTEDKDYEPYCGGQASPNPDYPQEIKVVTGNNVIKHVGKNLLNKDDTFTNKYIDDNGVSHTSKVDATFDEYISINQNTDYIYHSNKSVRNLAVSFYDKNKNFIQRNIARNANYLQVTAPNNAEYILLSLSYNTTDTVTQDVINNLDLQLEQGSTPTPYEPYREEEYELDLWKENEFDKNNVNKLNAYIDSSNKITSSEATRTLYIECKKNTLYKISKAKSARFRAMYTTDIPAINRVGNGYIVNDSGEEIIIKTGNNAKYLCVFYYHTNQDTLTEQEILESIQIQEAIELCKIGDYSDILFKNEVGDENYNAELEDETWYKKKAIDKVVLDGSENWGIGTTNVYYTDNILNYAISNNRPYNNYYKGILNVSSAGAMANQDNNTCAFNNDLSNKRFYVKDESKASSTDFKTWISSNNITVYYALNTPIYEQITDPTLISQLEALRKAKWFKGVNHWWTETENLEPVLKGSYKQSNNIKNKQQDERLTNIESRLALLE